VLICYWVFAFKRLPLILSQSEAKGAESLTRMVSSNDSIEIPLTAAPSQPTGRLVTSISTTGSVGGATAVGVDTDYLAVSVDQQQTSSVSKQVPLSEIVIVFASR